jgi:transposase
VPPKRRVDVASRRLYPDHKSIAEFRRAHREAVTAAGAELVRFAKSCGLIRGEWIAIDGSKFRAVASIDTVRERLALQRYLDSLEKADEETQANIDHSAVQAALEKLKAKSRAGSRLHTGTSASFTGVQHSDRR